MVETGEFRFLGRPVDLASTDIQGLNRYFQYLSCTHDSRKLICGRRRVQATGQCKGNPTRIWVVGRRSCCLMRAASGDCRLGSSESNWGPLTFSRRFDALLSLDERWRTVYSTQVVARKAMKAEDGERSKVKGPHLKTPMANQHWQPRLSRNGKTDRVGERLLPSYCILMDSVEASMHLMSDQLGA
jgi:hypothetical protein